MSSTRTETKYSRGFVKERVQIPGRKAKRSGSRYKKENEIIRTNACKEITKLSYYVYLIVA
jgi:hypothetical protein